ncbi:MAG TPA: mechanosensitive ion channel family protein [Bacillus sp. (in: firmicutes)]|uniref:mechanosensitive ion channel family protein n=1 Tax=Bacillus litorisediminis TaxID=2922713 RepID=UPI001FAF121A|nr:mechanosensitive ion channel family protein [Bacillus litorisediminis]HWO74561.1 mechanosensitive ion channel family protein [Bacillus sp. (in: firmicutes)]
MDVSIDLLKELGISVAIILAFLLLRKLFTTYIFNFITGLFKRKSTEFVFHILLAFEGPLRWLFVSIGVFLALDQLSFMNEYMWAVIRIYRASIIALLAWGFYNLTAASSLIFQNINKRFNLEMDEMVAPFLSRIARFIIIALALSVIAQEFDYDVNGFIAGLGLGGLAFALAAQDTVKNVFGGFVIITEKPFTIGDWIKTKSVEGTVEDISFRSTIVRTFAQALVTVPNSTLANEAITNWSKMGKRQITFTLPVSGQAPPDKLNQFIENIREYLKNNEDIHQETIFVTFDMIENGNFEVFFYLFTKTTVWGEYLQIKEQLNFEILRMLEEANIELAYPTRSLYLANVEERQFSLEQDA